MMCCVCTCTMQKAAQESKDVIQAALDGADMVFVTVRLQQPELKGSAPASQAKWHTEAKQQLS